MKRLIVILFFVASISWGQQRFVVGQSAWPTGLPMQVLYGELGRDAFNETRRTILVNGQQQTYFLYNFFETEEFIGTIYIAIFSYLEANWGNKMRVLDYTPTIIVDDQTLPNSVRFNVVGSGHDIAVSLICSDIIGGKALLELSFHNFVNSKVVTARYEVLITL